MKKLLNYILIFILGISNIFSKEEWEQLFTKQANKVVNNHKVKWKIYVENSNRETLINFYKIQIAKIAGKENFDPSAKIMKKNYEDWIKLYSNNKNYTKDLECTFFNKHKYSLLYNYYYKESRDTKVHYLVNSPISYLDIGTTGKTIQIKPDFDKYKFYRYLKGIPSIYVISLLNTRNINFDKTKNTNDKDIIEIIFEGKSDDKKNKHSIRVRVDKNTKNVLEVSEHNADRMLNNLTAEYKDSKFNIPHRTIYKRFKNNGKIFDSYKWELTSIEKVKNNSEEIMNFEVKADQKFRIWTTNRGNKDVYSINAQELIK